MAGMFDYSAQATLDWETGRAPMPALVNRFLALYTTAPNDSGGGTEVSGNGYARVQVAGGVTASTSITGGSTTTITVNTGQTWIVPGMNVYDVTAAKQIGTVLTYVSGTGVITLTAAASNSGSGSTDALQISGWPASSASSGAEPATSPASVTNGAQITFAQATGAGWGTVTSFGIFDAVTSGNAINWDYLGTFKWIPFSATSASPSVLTVDSAADAPANGASCVVTQKYGGTLPTTAGSWAGILTSAGLSGATFNLGVNSTSIGGGEFRQVATQSIPGNVTASFSAAQLALSVA
jgi:hypothetical protein